MPPAHTLVLTHTLCPRLIPIFRPVIIVRDIQYVFSFLHLNSKVLFYTQYTALFTDGKNFSCGSQLLLCGRAANVLHVKEHFHVIIIHLFLSWSRSTAQASLEEKKPTVWWCFLSTISLGVASPSVFPRQSHLSHVRSQRLVVAKTSLAYASSTSTPMSTEFSVLWRSKTHFKGSVHPPKISQGVKYQPGPTPNPSNTANWKWSST